MADVAAKPLARILVVDDEPNVLETIAAILRREKYDVIAADSADAALKVLHRSPIDVVLTDLRLAADDGITILAQIRKHWINTVAIVLTGYASLQSAIDALREGAYDYLIKPCDVEELKATVARAVERGALGRALQERIVELDAANLKLQSFNAELSRQIEVATAEFHQNIAELAEAKQQLEHEQASRDEFISMIAHELGQPLTTILGSAQLLERPMLSEEGQTRARNSILSQTRRLIRLVRDLADASNVAAGRFRVEPIPFNLTELVREQIEQAQVGSDRHQISLETGEPVVSVHYDRDRIAQVLSNLITNAVKYTPGGEVRVNLSRERDQLVVKVRDRGPGIPPDQLEEVFKPHVRLLRGDLAGQTKGTGLGLYIARAIVEAHGGRIWAENRADGPGAIFVLSLPSPGSATR